MTHTNMSAVAVLEAGKSDVSDWWDSWKIHMPSVRYDGVTVSVTVTVTANVTHAICTSQRRNPYPDPNPSQPQALMYNLDSNKYNPEP